MSLARQYLLLVLTALLAPAAGCFRPVIQPCRSPLKPAQMSADSVVLEMFFIRVPYGDAAANDTLWKEIDEQHFSPDMRQRLSRNGFRAGMIVGQLPVELSKLLELADKPVDSGKSEGTKVDSLEAEPRVVRRRLQLRADHRGEIIASGVYDTLTVLTNDGGRLSGRTFAQGQGLLAVKTFPQPDGRVRLELVPELHHGQPRQRWVGGAGMIRLDTSRDRQVYADMTLSAELDPGAMLVLGCLPDRQGSLGHYFFTEESGRLEQKLLVIRLSQTQHDGLFNPPAPPESQSAPAAEE
jgi:hypothetical protein